MGKFVDGMKKVGAKLGVSKLRWPKRKPTVVEKRQISRWEGEGGSVRDTD
jgi:hypothetical protein